MTLFQLPEAEPKAKAPKNRNRTLRCEYCNTDTWLGSLVISAGRAICTTKCNRRTVQELPVYPHDDVAGEDPWPLTKRAKAVLAYEEAA